MLIYVCENDFCPRFEKRTGVDRDQPSDCPICGWSMSAVPGATLDDKVQ